MSVRCQIFVFFGNRCSNFGTQSRSNRDPVGIQLGCSWHGSGSNQSGSSQDPVGHQFCSGTTFAPVGKQLKSPKNTPKPCKNAALKKRLPPNKCRKKNAKLALIGSHRLRPFFPLPRPTFAPKYRTSRAPITPLPAPKRQRGSTSTRYIYRCVKLKYIYILYICDSLFTAILSCAPFLLCKRGFSRGMCARQLSSLKLPQSSSEWFSQSLARHWKFISSTIDRMQAYGH